METKFDTSRPAEVFDLPDIGPLAAVLCHFNPYLYEAPVANLRIVLSWLASEGLPTYAVEVRSGLSLNTPPALPASHPKVLQLQAKGNMFRKDNLWNIGAALLPDQFRYVLFLDADVILTEPNWKDALLDALARDRVVQPFAKAVWTDSAQNPFKEKLSCGFGFQTGLDSPQLSHHFHAGFALAAPRQLCAETTGFYNCPIGGGSLFLMSAIMGLENELEPKLAEVCPPLLTHYRTWAKPLREWVRGSLGYIDGDAVHLWHGSRQKRRYRDRFDCLVGFDPKHDIEAVAPFGLHDWSPTALSEKRVLIRRVEEYFVAREEDETFLAS